MNRDPLLEELARKRRDDQAAEDPRLSRLVRGELSPEEEAQLKGDSEGDAELALLYEAHRPVLSATKDAIFERALASRKSALKSPPAPPVRVLPWRRTAIFAVSFAAAAGALLWVNRPIPEERIAMVSDLPEYGLLVTGGDKVQRKVTRATPENVRLEPDSKLELVVRPKDPVTGPTVVRGFLIQGGVARAWTPRIDRSSDGAARVAGTAGELLGTEPGIWTVAFAVGRSESVPIDPNVVAAAVSSESATQGYRLLVTRVEVVAPR